VAELFHINSVGVLGATSFVGKSLLPLLASSACQVSAFSRQPVPHDGANINWNQLPSTTPTALHKDAREITSWVCVAPIAVLPDYLPWMKSMGARRIVALSSTSRFTKTDSSDVAEQALAKRIVDSEQQFITWAEAHGIEWIILRPTLIYGLGLDKNTIVIFTGDNGGVTSGDSYSTSNSPLRGGKGYQCEGGIREPYFISVPWMKIDGKRCDFPYKPFRQKLH